MFHHSVRTLRQSFEFFRDNPTGRLVVNRSGGFPLPLSASEFRHWFRSALHRKINERGGLTIPEDDKRRELARFHRDFTGNRHSLRSHNVRCAGCGCSKRLQARLMRAFASRVDDDE